MYVGKPGRFRLKRSRREWTVRLLLMLFALSMGQLGATLFLLSALGSDPYSVYCQGLATVLGITVGMANLGCTLLILAVFLAATKGYVLPGTIVCSFFAGPFIDIFYRLLGASVTSDSPMGLRMAVAVMGTLLIAFCVALMIKADGGMVAADMVPVFFSDRVRMQYRWAKMAWDVILVSTGFGLGGIVGVGTIIAAMLVGPAAQLLFPAMDWLVGKVVGNAPVS